MATSRTFDYVYGDLKLHVVVTETATGICDFHITCLQGFADINAIYWDGLAGGTFDLGTKKDNSLSMNGTGVAWDGGIALSATGLGSALAAAGMAATVDGAATTGPTKK